MSKLTTLKIFAATYVSECDLSSEDKIELIDLIKEGEYNDVLDIIEGEYKAPQISDYVAEELNYILEAKPPPRNIPNKEKVRSRGWGIRDYGAAKRKRKGTEKAVRKYMPDASKKSVKGAKHFVKPLKRIERVALGKSLTKTGGAAAGIALAAAGAQAVYKNYMSKAARVCKGKANKEICMANFRKKAGASKNIHKIKRLRVAKNDCVNASNPVLCRRKLDKRIKKLKEGVEIFIVSELGGGFMGPFGRALDVLFVFELGGMAYKRFFSKAAKACKGSSDRKLCTLRYKIKAKEAQMRTISSKAGICAKDKNPAKCKSKIGRKLQSLKSDVVMLRQEVG
ncbi:MAG: hypothetical protein ACTSVO_15235 [Candidatus Heimdallarchaeaceae archaeon]